MSDQVTNKSDVAEQSHVRVLDTALPSSTSSSDRLLSKNRDFALHIGGGRADGVRLLRKLDLHYGCPGGISRRSCSTPW
jgi:hypothetical protein